MSRSVGTHPSRAKMCRYMILKIIDWGGEAKFNDLERWSGMEAKHLVDALRRLLSWKCIDKKIGEDGYTVYFLTPHGKGLIKNYEEKQHLKEYWTPPWE